jgi:hypothetical protein
MTIIHSSRIFASRITTRGVARMFSNNSEAVQRVKDALADYKEEK